jgi:penicillin-binding protein 1A
MARPASHLRSRARLVGCFIALSLVSSACEILPSLEEVESTAARLPQSTSVYSTDGTRLLRLHGEVNRIPVTIDQIPRVVQDAVVAIEDQRFWQHGGVDVKALIRAAYVNAQTGRISEGGSTISQQYVKNALIGRERTLGRKLKEAVLAYQLEQQYSKQTILEKYLNTVYFGQGAYGIKAAARKFFRKQPMDLTLAEAALLAGLIASPESYDPVDNPTAALTRRNHVLDRMRALGMIPVATYESTVDDPLGIDIAPERGRYPAPYFVDYLKRWMLQNPQFGETYTQRYQFLFEGGYEIDSTVNLRMQRAAEAAIQTHLGYEGAPSAALVAIDPRTGYVRAMVGGRDFFAKPGIDSFAQVNLATGGITGRQTGSAFKVFTLATAIEQGISLNTTFVGPGRITIQDPACPNWQPQNYGGGSYGSMSLVSATASSVNTIFAQLVAIVGPENVVDMAHRLGITSDLDPYCAITLGSEEVAPLEMASSFATLAAGGIRRRPTPVASITDREGKTVMRFPPSRGKRVVEENVVHQVVYALRQVVCCGTGTNAYLGPWVAGKTGTTNDNADVYFCGMTTVLVACIWVGFPEGRISTGFTSGLPAAIWGEFMRSVLGDRIPPEFPEPEEFTGTTEIDHPVIVIAPEPSPTPVFRPRPRPGFGRPPPGAPPPSPEPPPPSPEPPPPSPEPPPPSPEPTGPPPRGAQQR